jgi:hypothetical protein
MLSQYLLAESVVVAESGYFVLAPPYFLRRQ